MLEDMREVGRWKGVKEGKGNREMVWFYFNLNKKSKITSEKKAKKQLRKVS